MPVLTMAQLFQLQLKTKGRRKKEMSSPKRIKLDEIENKKKKMEILSILSDEMSSLPTSKTYFAGKISDRKDTSRIMAELNLKAPVECIGHVKRVNRHNEVLLCSSHQLLSTRSELPRADLEVNDSEQVKRFLLRQNVSEDLAEKVSREVRVVEIPDYQPGLRWQYEAVTSKWPCKFHENKYLERLWTNTLFNDAETMSHQKFIEICEYLSNDLNGVNVGLAVNPYNNRIVAFGFDKTPSNPVCHCSMDLIDQVAITQGGGAWATKHDDDYRKLSEKVATTFHVDFGEGDFTKSSSGDNNLQKFGPYLCTGYSIYLLNEPCLMCSMALIHSRAKRVFYHRQQSFRGGLGSMTKLHTNKNLNHRYEAFHVVSSDRT